MQHQPVATQLSIAVADLAIQMDKAWPRVRKPIRFPKFQECRIFRYDIYNDNPFGLAAT